MAECNPDKPQKRVRCTQACDQCRRRKAKCDGSTDCSACRSLGLSCSYGLRIKQSKGSAYIVHLENKVHELETVLNNLRRGSSNSDNLSISVPPSHLAGQEWDYNLSPDQISPDSRQLEELMYDFGSMPALDFASEGRSDSLPDIRLQDGLKSQLSDLETASAATIPGQMRECNIDAIKSDDSTEIGSSLSPDETIEIMDSRDINSYSQTPSPTPDDVGYSLEELTEHQLAQPRSAKKSITQLRERNRVAAAKCRVKKKKGFEYLKAKHVEEQTRNDFLKNEVMALRNQLVDLRTMMLAHNMTEGGCGCASLHKHNHQMAMKPGCNTLGSKMLAEQYLVDPQTTMCAAN